MNTDPSRKRSWCARGTALAAAAAMATAGLVGMLAAPVCNAGVRWTPNGVSIQSGPPKINAGSPAVTSDGSNGAIIAWPDARNGMNYDIYAQKVDSTGAALWTPNGVRLRETTLPENASRIQIARDGSGGAIVTWEDRIENDDIPGEICVQRVDSMGTARWGAGGVVLRGSPLISDAYFPQIAPDEAGGAVITWEDFRGGMYSGVYAQKVDSSGTPLWTINGIKLSDSSKMAGYPQVVGDGTGGAIVTWSEWEVVRAQRVSAEGTLMWVPGGMKLRDSSTDSSCYPDIASDGSGGAIVAWDDSRGGHIYAQKVNASGTQEWTANGVALSAAHLGLGAYNPLIASDGSAGAIVTWHDDRSGQEDIYAQRLDSSGALQWTTDGLMIRGAPNTGNAFPSGITSDGSGGAVITWEDNRNGQSDIYAQKVNCSGVVQWPWKGVMLRGAPVTGDAGGSATASDGSGGVIAAWQDYRSGTEYSIYAQRVIDGPREALSTWYLAEGTNLWGFSTYITIENPNDEPVTAQLTYMDTSARGIAGTRTIELPARSETTVFTYLDTDCQIDFSTKVECLQGKTIAVDRTMFWIGPDASAAQSGYHSAIGATFPSMTWFLPEGSSAWGFETWTLIQNPNPTPANITLTYMPECQGPKAVPKTIPAYSRATFNMASDIGAADTSIRVSSDVPVIAERSMYRDNRREGSCSAGAAQPSKNFYLAEGATGYDSGFVTYVLVQNPQATSNDVTLTYQTHAGEVQGPSFTMQPGSRKTVRVNDVIPPDTSVSTHVYGSEPLVAERAVYWDSGDGEAFAASIGTDSPCINCMCPDGEVSEACETWTLVQNPNPVAVTVRVTYLPQGGGAPVSFTDVIPFASRSTYNMAEKIQSGRASVLVESLDSMHPVIVERAMYWNDRGAGTDTIGGFTD